MEGLSCATCGFDAAAWTRLDAVTTLGVLSRWWRNLVEPVPADDPRVTELAAHAGTIRCSARVARTAGELADPAVAEHLHEGWHALVAGGRVVHRGRRAERGRVVQVNASGGGVPKLPVDGAWIGSGGLVGDRQGDRRYHGRPWQALCLWSADVLGAVRAEGHPVAAGCVGENLTLAGLDWRGVTPGLRLSIGAALVETTAYTVPCRKIAHWFRDGDVARIAHERHPGSSRIYARVLRPGAVLPADAVVVEPGVEPGDREDRPAVLQPAVGRMGA